MAQPAVGQSLTKALRTFRWRCGLLAVGFTMAGQTAAQAIAWHFDFVGQVPYQLVWQADPGRSYNLWLSPDLLGWTAATGFPQAGTGGPMAYPFTAGTMGFFRISWNDGFVLIPTGSFQMGNALSGSGDGTVDETPVHTVNVSAFYMAQFLVTKAL